MFDQTFSGFIVSGEQREARVAERDEGGVGGGGYGCSSSGGNTYGLDGIHSNRRINQTPYTG